jgi:two-component system, OmpR family, sensor histidine kinase TctE
VLGGISIYTHYFSAMNAATLAYDRTLLASARTVAERLVVRNGRLEADVPYVVLDSFERNMNDQLYYEVISPQGVSISGYDESADDAAAYFTLKPVPGAGAFL